MSEVISKSMAKRVAVLNGVSLDEHCASVAVTPQAKSTARAGNPKQASRGAAVDRAREAFYAAHDERIWRMERRMYAELIGLELTAGDEEIMAKIGSASIEELEAWTRGIEEKK